MHRRAAMWNNKDLRGVIHYQTRKKYWLDFPVVGRCNVSQILSLVYRKRIAQCIPPQVSLINSAL